MTASLRANIGFICLLAWMALPRTGAAEAKFLETQVGYATFYAQKFQGQTTASGTKFDNQRAVAAHRTYPFGTVVRVTNIRNGKSVNVVIVDRGPYGKNRREGTVIDLSQKAAQNIGIIREGQARVRVDVLKWGRRAH